MRRNPTPKRARKISSFVQLISEIVEDFDEHPLFPSFRVPRRRVALDPLSDHAGFTRPNGPHSISRALFKLEWDSLMGFASHWHLYALRLPCGDRVYWVDDLDGRRIVAI